MSVACLFWAAPPTSTSSTPPPSHHATLNSAPVIGEIDMERCVHTMLLSQLWKEVAEHDGLS